MTLPVVEAAMEDLRLAHRELLRVVDSLSDADWERAVPYGEWTVKDLVAHCIGDMSPSGVGLILAGVLTPQFIADTARTFDVRARNASLVDERRGLAREDLRQMLFSCHDAMHNAALKLTEEHLPVLAYSVPMGPGYDLHVEDWLWHGYHDRQHADDIRRALQLDWRPEPLTFVPEIEATLRAMTRYREGFIRAVYSVAEDAWDEEASSAPGWSYKDLLAHVASNDLRAQTRLRALLGERDDAELAALEDEDAWNLREVEKRRGHTFPQLVEELDANRHDTIEILSRIRSEHHSTHMPLAHGETATPTEYIEMVSGHEARHGAQLVPASRARRWRKT
jgi:predicted DNA-binding ribbon-helix-helix protein